MGMLLRRHKVEATKIANLETTPKKATEKVVEQVTPVGNDGGESHDYTRSEIMGMKVDELKVVGAKVGIENADELSGTKLKVAICEKLGL